jgi:hypothetical protein
MVHLRQIRPDQQARFTDMFNQQAKARIHDRFGDDQDHSGQGPRLEAVIQDRLQNTGRRSHQLNGKDRKPHDNEHEENATPNVPVLVIIDPDEFQKAVKQATPNQGDVAGCGVR